jgi:lysocardiolipin and lysophospholipid acyltransferase
MYWRRFAISSIPLDDPEKFDLWLRERWTEKDALIEQYVATGRFPESKDLAINGTDSEPSQRRGQSGFLESNVKTAHIWEFLQIFVVLGTFGWVANILAKVWNAVFHGKSMG